jgi:hypothetical protein
MIERDLQEWEEYDARLLEDDPGSAPATQRSEFPRNPVETGAASESPFLLGNTGEIEAETEGIVWERSGRTSAHGRPKLRTGRPAQPRLPSCNCDGDASTDDPVAVDTGASSESEGFAEMKTEGMAWERGARRAAHRRPMLGTWRPTPPRPTGCNCDGSTDEPVINDTNASSESEGFEQLEIEALTRADSQESWVHEAEAPIAPDVDPPPGMRPTAWRYLLQFTKQHEGAVFHMYNNRSANSTVQDVTCGVGFRLDPRSAVTKSWVKEMFFDRATQQTPSDDQMLADWDAAANLARTGDNLKQYATVCQLRMYPDKVYRRMALTLRDVTLPEMLRRFSEFKDFPSFPAAAQVFTASFSYAGPALPRQFPHMRAAIKDRRWADASKACYIRGASERKNKAHAELLLWAQRVANENLDPDTLPQLDGPQAREFETRAQFETEAIPSGAWEAEGDGALRQWNVPAEMSSEIPYEVDPYADIRHALLSEHASLPADELTFILGRRPTLVALHRILASPEPRLASLAVLLGKAGKRSVHLSGTDVPLPAYLRLLSKLCREAAEEAEETSTLAENLLFESSAQSMENQLSLDGEATAAGEGPFELQFEEEIPGANLQWPGATQEQMDFMRAVYARHVANAQARRTFIADVAASELSLVENGHRLRTEAAGQCVTMLADVRSAIAAAQRTGDSSALQIKRIFVVSGYRSASEQFTIWQNNFRKYYRDTASPRASLSGGEHGPSAIPYLASYIGRRLGAPGFSNHNDGLAIDFGADLAGNRRLTSDSGDTSIKLWRSSWLFWWLSTYGTKYGFFQNSAINEPWHWEYRHTSATLQTQEEIPAVVSTPYILRAGSTYISNTGLLSAHRGTQPDLYVCWNDMSGVPSSVDVIVHLHGHSADGGRMLLRNKVALSGLDYCDPSGSGQCRTRKSVGIIPRGHYDPRPATAVKKANPDVYSFPALVGKSAMRDLIAYGLGRFANYIGANNTISQSRLILTCHSGGGDWLGAILNNIDPDEIHLFDAIYGVPNALLTWIGRHVTAGTPGTSAFRMFYTDSAWTTPHAKIIAAQVRNALQKANSTAALAPYFKVEVTGVQHPDIPRTYGWQLLVDASALVLPQTKQLLPL